MNDDDFVDPSLTGKLRLCVYLAALAICSLPFVTWRPMHGYLRSLPICEGLPWLRAYIVSALVVFVLFIAAFAWYGLQTVRSGQSPLPDAIVFRRTKVIRGPRIVLQGYVFCGNSRFAGWPAHFGLRSLATLQTDVLFANLQRHLTPNCGLLIERSVKSTNGV